MENRIYQMKDKLLTKIEGEMQDMDRMDVREVGCLIDAVHHLAETEYYCAVADSMWAEKHGYTSGGGTGSSTPVTQARMSYSQQPMRSGYAPMPTPEPMYYHEKEDPMESLRRKYQAAMPDERERIRMEALKLVGAM